MVYNISISGTVPVSCWIKPQEGGRYEVFCNTASGFEVIATNDGVERVVYTSDNPEHKVIELDLDEGDSLTVRPFV